jgi:pre-mRNA-splicing factor ATP-dependent RNA helicase DHX15/PRP43
MSKQFLDLLDNNQVIVLTSETGAGKTLVIPKLVVHYFGYKGKVVTTIPKRTYVSSGAAFGAKTLDAELGKEVGYRHGTEKNMDTPETILLYATDGSITAKMTSTDPDLEEYSAVVIDEVHERSVNIDVLILLLRSMLKRRSDFKLVLMSATIDVPLFTNYFEKEGIKTAHFHASAGGTNFPIDTVWLPKAIDKKKYDQYVYAHIASILKNTKEGNIIAFVVGLPPAIRLCQKLNEDKEKGIFKENFLCLPFSATTDQSTADMILLKDPDFLALPQKYSRKIVIGTNALEASITVDKAVYVIESGLANTVYYDAKKFADVSDVTYISKASMTQRKGRTGRNCAGRCYHLYTKEIFEETEDFNLPEIVKSNFMSNFIRIMGLPMNQLVSKTLPFIADMITPPPIEAIESAIYLLYNLSLVNAGGALTDLGKGISQFGGKFTPELARMILCGYYFDCFEEVCMLATVMASVSGTNSIASFIKEPNKKSETFIEDQALFEKKMKKYAHPKGDHLTLLRIVQEFFKTHPLDREDWCNRLGFNPKLFFEAIEIDFEDLKASIQEIDFPEVFAGYPVPDKREKGPQRFANIVKEAGDKIIKDFMKAQREPEPRFQFTKYGDRQVRLDAKAKDGQKGGSGLAGLKEAFSNYAHMLEKKHKKVHNYDYVGDKDLKDVLKMSNNKFNQRQNLEESISKWSSSLSKFETDPDDDVIINNFGNFRDIEADIGGNTKLDLSNPKTKVSISHYGFGRKRCCGTKQSGGNQRIGRVEGETFGKYKDYHKLAQKIKEKITKEKSMPKAKRTQVARESIRPARGKDKITKSKAIRERNQISQKPKKSFKKQSFRKERNNQGKDNRDNKVVFITRRS